MILRLIYWVFLALINLMFCTFDLSRFQPLNTNFELRFPHKSDLIKPISSLQLESFLLLLPGYLIGCRRKGRSVSSPGVRDGQWLSFAVTVCFWAIMIISWIHFNRNVNIFDHNWICLVRNPYVTVNGHKKIMSWTDILEQPRWF